MEILFLNLENRRDIEKKAIFPSLPELGLVYLAEFLKREGFEVGIYDEHLDGPVPDEVIASAKYVGISMYGLNNRRNLQRVEEKKRRFPKLKFILGGSSIGSDITEKPDFIDHLVIGAGYDPLLEILTGTIKPILYGGSEERDFPFQFSVIPLSRYTRGVLLSAWGCPFRCSFCLSPHLKSYRVRREENVLAELDLILNTPEIKYFEFFDNLLPINPYLDKILARIRGRKPWGCVSDIRRNNDEFFTKLERMIECGLTTIGFGIESLNDTTLMALNKKQTAREVDECLRRIAIIASDSFRPHVFLMYGLPFQTYQDFQTDLKRVSDYGLPAQCTHLKVIKGTVLWNKRMEYGIELNDDYQVTQTNWMDENELRELDNLVEGINLETISQVWKGL